MSDNSEEYALTSELDDTRGEEDDLKLEEELLKDEYEEADVKTEAKEELEDSFPVSIEPVVVKTEQTVEEVDQLDLDEIDESSCHSWSEPVQVYEEKPLPASGRTTPDHEIQPPTKRGRLGHDGSSNRTGKNNTKREFTRKIKQPPAEREADETTLKRRQKQIDYGKVTVDYEEYLVSVPKSSRKPFHPRTPDKYQKTSRRGFDSQIKNWKIKIHNWQNLDKKEWTKKSAQNTYCIEFIKWETS